MSTVNLEMENAMLKEKIKKLEAGIMAWKIIAKQEAKLANLTPDEKCRVLNQALDSTTADLCDAWDTIEKLKAENERIKRKVAIQ